MRVKSTITLDQELLKLAHDLGLNVSKTCEDALQIRIQALQQARTQETNGLLTPVSSRKNLDWCGRRDLNPGRQRGSLSNLKLTSQDLDGFREFLASHHYRGSYRHTLFGYAKEYGDVLFSGDMSRVVSAPQGIRPNVMKALASLSKYLGVYEKFKELKVQYGLQWRGKSADDLIIDRLNKVQDPEQIFTWIREVKHAKPELSDFMDLMAISGLRLVEAVESHNLILELNNTGDIGSYYNESMSALEHFKFKDLFLRRAKKAFLSFVPKELLLDLEEGVKIASPGALGKTLRKRGIPCMFADIRENHGNFMTRWLRKEEIDFLHGRVTNDVFMQHYFNPALIGDIRARALKGIDVIMEKVTVD